MAVNLKVTQGLLALLAINLAGFITEIFLQLNLVYDSLEFTLCPELVLHCISI